MVGGNSNFVFLQTLEPQVYRLGLLAERYFVEDPNTCQIKLRQLSELIAQLTASRFGLVIEPSDNFADILRRLKFECSRGEVQRMLGNAVPSLVAEVLARAIRDQLLGKPVRRKTLQLLPPQMNSLPPPERVAKVPASFKALIGNHAAHPGTGQGNRARQRIAA